MEAHLLPSREGTGPSRPLRSLKRSLFLGASAIFHASLEDSSSPALHLHHSCMLFQHKIRDFGHFGPEVRTARDIQALHVKSCKRCVTFDAPNSWSSLRLQPTGLPFLLRAFWSLWQNLGIIKGRPLRNLTAWRCQCQGDPFAIWFSTAKKRS